MVCIGSFVWLWTVTVALFFLIILASFFLPIISTVYNTPYSSLGQCLSNSHLLPPNWVLARLLVRGFINIILFWFKHVLSSFDFFYGKKYLANLNFTPITNKH